MAIGRRHPHCGPYCDIFHTLRLVRWWTDFHRRCCAYLDLFVWCFFASWAVFITFSKTVLDSIISCTENHPRRTRSNGLLKILLFHFNVYRPNTRSLHKHVLFSRLPIPFRLSGVRKGGNSSNVCLHNNCMLCIVKTFRRHRLGCYTRSLFNIDVSYR